MRLSREILISESALKTRVEAMARAIAADTPDGGALSALIVLDGAFMFGGDLVRRLPMPVHTALVPLRSIDRGGDPRELRLPDVFPVDGADVLVVEDILDTGRTLLALKDELLRRRPRSLRIAVLLDKPARRSAPLVPDYVGFEVPDRWIVGYGLDAEGLYRNLPYISFLE